MIYRLSWCRLFHASWLFALVWPTSDSTNEVLNLRNGIPAHLLKQLHLSLCAKGGKAGCDVGRAKEGENVISEENACRVRVKLRRHRQHIVIGLCSLAKRRRQQTFQAAVWGEVVLEIIKGKNCSTWQTRECMGDRGNGGEKRPKVTQEMEQRVAHYRSQWVTG